MARRDDLRRPHGPPAALPALLVTSDDDPYCDPVVSASFARRWQARHVSVGTRGHIDSGSGIGDWPDGRELLRTFVESVTG